MEEVIEGVLRKCVWNVNGGVELFVCDYMWFWFGFLDLLIRIERGIVNVLVFWRCRVDRRKEVCFILFYILLVNLVFKLSF